MKYTSFTNEMSLKVLGKAIKWMFFNQTTISKVKNKLFSGMSLELYFAETTKANHLYYSVIEYTGTWSNPSLLLYKKSYELELSFNKETHLNELSSNLFKWIWKQPM